MSIRWLSLEEVLIMHDVALELDGGNPGVLDIRKLESAIAQPMAGFGDVMFHPSLEDQAAAYLFYVSEAHSFSDGNKRTGVLAALTFLVLNGKEPRLDEMEMYELALAVAKDNLDISDVARQFRGE